MDHCYISHVESVGFSIGVFPRRKGTSCLLGLLFDISAWLFLLVYGVCVLILKTTGHFFLSRVAFNKL